MYGSDLSRTFEGSFGAQQGHTYEITNKGNDINITDLTPGDAKGTLSLSECKYSKSWSDGKDYE